MFKLNVSPNSHSCALSLNLTIYEIVASPVSGRIFKNVPSKHSYGKPFYYLFYKSDIWFDISDILYNI